MIAPPTRLQLRKDCLLLKSSCPLSFALYITESRGSVD